jgi:hypothetical protein
MCFVALLWLPKTEHVAINTQSEHRLIVLLILHCCVDGNFTILYLAKNTSYEAK